MAADLVGTGGRSHPGDLGFFRTLATVMAIVQVTGFAFHFAMGRSSLSAPLVIHAHAVVFMGWVAIFVIQPWLAKAGNMGLHRTLGRGAAVWAVGLLVLGLLVTWETVRTGRTPFFFQPQHFLVANPLTLLGALGLLAAAISLRKHHDWHPRLQIGSFVLLMGPGFGRLLPMPFLTPYAFEVASLAALVFVAVAACRETWLHKRVHPAWAWTVIVLLGSLLFARIVAGSPIGQALHAAAVSGTAAEGSDGMAFPPPPPGI
jgi:hypothetical protein